jgi:hypothetical protein
VTVAVEIAAIVERMQAAGSAWESALDAHALAPPDAGFPGRLRALSSAAAEQASAFELAAEGGLGWRSRTIDGDFALAPELTPGMNRPGPDELWVRFDEAVTGLATALAGSSPAGLTGAFTELSEVSKGLAAQVQSLYRGGRLAG